MPPGGAFMNMWLICMAVIVGQMNTLQDMPVVHLQPQSGAIQVDFGGKQFELGNGGWSVHYHGDGDQSGCWGNDLQLLVHDYGWNG